MVSMILYQEGYVQRGGNGETAVPNYVIADFVADH